MISVLATKHIQSAGIKNSVYYQTAGENPAAEKEQNKKGKEKLR